MPDIRIRTDGNQEIATGHLMRCLTIARACAARGMSVCFAVADETSEALLRERFDRPGEFAVECLHSDYRDMNGELPALARSMKAAEASWILVDSYFVTEDYLAALRRICRVAYLDDIAAFAYPIDCVINYTINAAARPRQYRSIPHCLLGTSYAPLRKQFRDVPYTVRGAVEHILLSTGGTDPFRVAETLAATLSPGLQYHIVTSRVNPRYEHLLTLAAPDDRIHVYENVRDMAGLMARCDMAVSAGGTTLFELCAVGVPAICFTMADNQKNNAELFRRGGILPYAGDVRRDPDGTIKEIRRFLENGSANPQRRAEQSSRMRSYVDGMGAARIAAFLDGEPACPPSQ